MNPTLTPTVAVGLPRQPQGPVAATLPRHLGWRDKPASTLKAARVLLLATVLAAPLAFGAVQVWAWTSICILASLLLVLWALESFGRRAVRIAISPLYLPAIGLLLLGVIQLLSHRTMDTEGTREALLKLAGDLILFFVAVQLWSSPPTALTHPSAPLPLAGEGQRGEGRWMRANQHPSRWRRLGAIVTVYSFLLALFSLLQFFSSHGLIYWKVKTDGWVFGPYVNHNHYAGLMEMLIPVSVTYALSRRKKHGANALLGFAVILPIVSVLLSGSRAGCIALLFEILVIVAVMGWRSSPEERRRYAAAGAVGVVVVSVLFLWLGSGKIASRLASIGGLTRSPEVTLGNRLLVAEGALRMFRDHPWLGTGLGSFDVAYPQYQGFATDLDYHHAHNDYAEALAETGIFGALLMASALAVFFRQAAPHLRARFTSSADWIQFGAALGCCGILIHSLADFNLHIPANAAWFAFLLGVFQAK
jgi:O-antigen ligase